MRPMFAAVLLTVAACGDGTDTDDDVRRRQDAAACLATDPPPGCPDDR